MSKILNEFNQRLGSVKIYEDKVECTTKSGFLGFGEIITNYIEFENIRNIVILGIEQLGIGISSNPLNIKVIRIFAIDKHKIVTSKQNAQKNQNTPKDFLDIDMGLKSNSAQEIFDVINKIHLEILKTKEKERIEKERIEKEKERILEENRIKNLHNNISLTLINLDRNEDG